MHEHPSQEFVELRNLVNAARWHRKNCHSSCDVSLTMLKWTSYRLLEELWQEEYEIASKLIDETDWT